MSFVVELKAKVLNLSVLEATVPSCPPLKESRQLLLFLTADEVWNDLEARHRTAEGVISPGVMVRGGLGDIGNIERTFV